MTALAGWVEKESASCLDESALVAMLEPLSARTGSDDIVGVVERRPARRAVFAASLWDRASGIAVALDGTIANAGELRADLERRGYAFPRAAEAEVLLRAYQRWDRDVAKFLRGSFAFAVWDSRRDRLLLARDRFGVKPLFVREAGGTLFFASEAKALLRSPGARAELDPRAMREYLAHRYVCGGRTLFAGIRKLAPATTALWEFGRLRETRYWTPPDREPRFGPREREEDALEGFGERFIEAAAPGQGAAGMLLSGGIDSATVLAVLGEGGAVRTFSLGFEGDGKSELPQAAEVAKHFGTSHHEIVVRRSELAGSIARLVAERDAPLPRPSDLAVHRLAQEAGRSVRVLYTGDGADELLGGYRRYAMERFSEGFCRSLEEKRARWVDAVLPEKTSGPKAEESADPNSTPLRRALYRAQTTELPEEILERNERAAAAASLELRMPFLDHRLAEFVSGLPDDYRVRGLSTKWILREAAKRLVPPRLARRKGGFRVPAGDWMRNELRDTLLEHLQGPSSRTRACYDTRALDRMIERHLKGRQDNEMPLWTLLNLEIWHRQYKPA